MRESTVGCIRQEEEKFVCTRARGRRDEAGSGGGEGPTRKSLVGNVSHGMIKAQQSARSMGIMLPSGQSAEANDNSPLPLPLPLLLSIGTMST